MLIFGHRGAPSIKTENTLASFEAALSCNVDGIELDIQLTSDEKIIVYHDSEISDTNNLNHLISNLSFSITCNCIGDIPYDIASFSKSSSESG